MNKTQPTADALLKSVMGFISESRQQLGQGVLLDMSPMEENVQILCEIITQLDATERKAYAGPLESLYQQLSELGGDLTSVRDYLRSQMNELPTHQRANIAYKSADAVDNYGPKDSDNEEN